MHQRPFALVCLVAAALFIPVAASLEAQDVEGVRIGLTYDPSSKPGIVVLPIAGPAGDSIRTILQRDLDYGDRINVIGGQGSELSVPAGASGAPNYALYARLGATGVVEAVAAPGGALTVRVHDVNRKNVARTRAFQLPSAALS